ncbi:hypothetical protein D3C81_2110370 [compost metagenome]
MQFDRADIARGEAQLETGGRRWQAADLHQYTFERNIANPQAALLIMAIEQRAGGFHRQAPRAQHGAVFVDFG